MLALDGKADAAQFCFDKFKVLCMEFFISVIFFLDCSQPLYLAQVKENVSDTSAKHTGVGWGLQTKRARTKRETLDIYGKKVDLLDSTPCYQLVTASSTF